MSTRMPAPYDGLADSGQGWLGQIPRHWDCLPNRSLFREVKSQGHNTEPLLSVTISAGILPQETLLATTAKRDSSNLDKTKYKLVEPGDIAYNKMRAWQGAIGRSAYRGIVSPAYIVQRLRQRNDADYFHHLFRTPAFAAEAQRWSYGITSDQWSLRPQHFKMIYCCVPPVEEQQAIVRFIADLDRRVLRLVEAKRRLLTLIAEQQRAEVTRCVTTGLAESAETADSGVAWWPHRPAGWQLLPLKRHWRVTDCKHVTVPFFDEGVPVASVREARTFDIDLATAKRTSPEWFDVLIAGDRRPARGDILYCRNVSVGSAAYVSTDTPFAMGQDVCLIRTRSQNNRYLNYLLSSDFMARQLASFAVGATFSRINVDDVKALLVLVPPRDEQDAIVDHLDRVVGEYRLPAEGTLREIDLIREYRTRVVTDVVTGKLDVRDVAAGLPEVGAQDQDALALETTDAAELEMVEEASLAEPQGASA